MGGESLLKRTTHMKSYSKQYGTVQQALQTLEMKEVHVIRMEVNKLPLCTSL